MSLLDTRHQRAAHRQIQRALARDRVPHAYIFHGPEGVGKETFARGMAQLLLCPNPAKQKLDAPEAAALGMPEVLMGCGQCDDCRTVVAGTHPDLHLIYRQLNREHSDPAVRKRKGLELGVDVIREFLIDKVARTPQRGRAKVFIIREADVLNIEAQNALLKTLEEPPGTTYLILLTVALDYLLPTTQSRCQLVRFDALPDDFVRTRLKQMRPDLPDNQLQWYAAFAGGSIGEALRAVDDDLFEISRRTSEMLAASPRPGSGEVIKFYTDESKLLGEGFARRDPEITDTESARRALKTLFRLTADQLAGALRSVLPQETPQRASASAHGDRETSRAAIESHATRINRIAQAEQHLDLNANVQLTIETLVHDLLVKLQ